MNILRALILSLLTMIPAQLSAQAATGAPLRRPVTPNQPMWIVHIDSWNYADPQKIIDLVPQDIRPFVVMNISLSINHDEATSKWLRLGSGYETAKSWLRVCAENGMWATIQPSSGGFSHFSDFDLTVYEEFFREYPNFIGFNYCEQFWGYDSPTDPLSADWDDRINHFANLLPLCDKYGGYLIVSWCGNQWSPPINPIGMLKRVPAFAEACRNHTENYILCEKYTQSSYISDMESLCLGAYLSGYSGQYGIRYDDTGWTGPDLTHDGFTMATAGAAHLEHIMLTGMTVIDGPELIWTQCFRETNRVSAGDGFQTRAWATYPQFDNMSVDLFRKVLDGTVRIPTRREIIDRSKVVVINDVNSGNANNIYSSPQTMFEGLYRMDGDGNYEFNRTFFKKTGRYPTVPTVFALEDADANSFLVKVNRSAYATRWPTIQSKVNEFDALFPSEYTGDIYAGRHENGWVIYNPFKTGQTASGSIPFKYNTADRMEFVLSRYTAGVVKETASQLKIYLNNHDVQLDNALKTNTILIHGASSQPTWSFVNRGTSQAPSVTGDWSGGVLTLTVVQNGPVDITVNCSGAATSRLSAFTPAGISPPDAPAPYTGPRQYEGEHFDYKSIDGIDTNAAGGSVTGFRGQGYVRFGTSAAASVRDRVSVPGTGAYRLQTRYSVEGGNRAGIDLYVNGSRVTELSFPQTASFSDWAELSHNVTLNAGTNTVEFRATTTGTRNIYLDSIILTPTSYGYGTIFQENEIGFGGVDGVIANNNPGFTGSGFSDTTDVAGAGIRWQVVFDASPVKSFTIRYACTSDLVANLSIDGRTAASGIRFPSTGSLTTWAFATVHAGASEGVSDVRLQAVSTAGLPNIDYAEIGGGGVGLVESIESVEDTYVRDGAYAATNFGTATELVVKKPATAGTGFARNTYLKFDVAGLADAASVKLKLIPYQVDGAATLEYGLLENDSWTETGVTWNNQPEGATTPIGWVSGHTVGQPIELDVTAAARSQASGDGILSIRITEPGASNIFVGFHSRETTRRPVLEYVIPVSSNDPSLIARMRFDEGTGTTATDSTGNGWNGSLINNPSWVAGTGARIHGALSLAGGAGQYVALPSGLLDGVGDFTVSCWVNPTTVSTWARVFDFSTGTTQNSMYFTPRTAGGVARFGLRVNGVAQNLEAAAPLAAGAWTHVAVTLSGNSATLFLNGTAAATNTAMTNRPSALGYTTVNSLGRSSSSDPYLDGALDEFRLYDKALTADEIATLAAMPDLPTHLSATPADSRISLSWNAVSGSSAYAVMRSMSSGGPFSKLATVTGTSHTDTSVVNGTPYFYQIEVIGGIAHGSISHEQSATPFPTYPQWIAASFPGQTSLSVIGASADPDHDGSRNLIEYFLGGNPASPDLQGAVTAVRDGGGNLVLTYRMAKALSGVTHSIQSSNDATNWHNTGIAPVAVSDPGSHLLMKATVPTNGASPMFLRIEVRSE